MLKRNLINIKTVYTQVKFQSSKIYDCKVKVLDGVKDNDMILIGGFGLCGIPQNLLEGLVAKKTQNLTIVSNNCGIQNKGNGMLLAAGQIKKLISSYVGENKDFERLYFNGQLQCELTPQGTLAEKIRAGGAGIPAFYTPTGVGTWVEEGKMPISLKDGGKVTQIASKPKESKIINGRKYIMEESIYGDVALVKAWKADKNGNLQYRYAARNFNQDMATAASLVIAEVEELVEVGEIPPDQVHTPSIYVDRIIKTTQSHSDKHIEKYTFDTSDDAPVPEEKKPQAQKIREKIIKRAVKYLTNGMHLNLGIGIPTLVPGFADKGMHLTLQSENGLLGLGNYPKKGQEDPDMINAGKEITTLIPGGSAFSSSASFAMVRGRHLDLTILGALQVSKTGDIANWMIPGKMVKGMGGAMDLVGSGSKVMVVMEHTAKGQHKILESCQLPLTGVGCVDYLITELAVFEKQDGELVLIDIATETTLEEVRQATGYNFKMVDKIGRF